MIYVMAGVNSSRCGGRKEVVLDGVSGCWWMLVGVGDGPGLTRCDAMRYD